MLDASSSGMDDEAYFLLVGQSLNLLVGGEFAKQRGKVSCTPGSNTTDPTNLGANAGLAVARLQ